MKPLFSRILKYSIVLYLLITFIMLIQSIREKEKKKFLMWSLLFIVPAVIFTVFLCQNYELHELIYKAVSVFTGIFLIVTCHMTLESIKVKKKKQALIWGTLFFLPIILFLVHWGLALSIL